MVSRWDGDGQGDVPQLLVENAGMFAAFDLSQERERQVHGDLRLVVAVEIFLQLCQSFPDGQEAIVFRHDDGRRPFPRRIPADVVFFAPFQQPIRWASRRQRLASRRCHPGQQKKNGILFKRNKFLMKNVLLVGISWRWFSGRRFQNVIACPKRLAGRRCFSSCDSKFRTG